jgi:excisionase family DNA binding protein
MATSQDHHVGTLDERWLTTREVTAALKVTPGTLYRLVRIAALPAARVGGQWRFKASDLDDWLVRRRGRPRR